MQKLILRLNKVFYIIIGGLLMLATTTSQAQDTITYDNSLEVKQNFISNTVSTTTTTSTYIDTDSTNSAFIRSDSITSSFIRTDSTNSAFIRADSANSTFIRTDSIVTGAIRLSNTVWDDLRVPLTNTKLTPTKSEPVFEDIGSGVNAYGFDADADSTEALHFAAQLPHGYALGEDIEVHIHWLPETTNTGNVKWKFRWHMAAINDTLMAIDSFYVVDAADGVALKHQLADFGDIPGDSLGISAMIIGNVARCGEDAEDTFTGTAYGVEIDFHVPFTDFGSPEEAYKEE